MADIELVIKISKEDYETIKKDTKEFFSKPGHKVPTLYKAVVEGTPLPKGHGRLYDERDIVNGNYEIIGNRIYELEPIIEADKGQER